MDVCLQCGYKFSVMEVKIASTCPICGKETRRHEKQRESEKSSDIGTGRITRKSGEGTDAHVAALAKEAVMMSPFASFISPSLIKSLFGLSILSCLFVYGGIIAFMYFQFGLYYGIAAAGVFIAPLIFFILCIRLLLETIITIFSVRDVLTAMNTSKRKRSTGI